MKTLATQHPDSQRSDPLFGAVGTDPNFVAKATELVPLLRANAAASEERRELLDETIDALSAAGLLEITTPLRFGGAGKNFRTFIDTTAEIARGDGSAGWTAGLLNVCTWFATLFSEQAQQEVFGARHGAKVCGSIFAPKGGVESVSGGFRVTGQWPYCSGSAWADWATLAITTGERNDGNPIQGLALIPLSDLSIKDTWYVAGMKATASNTLVAEEVFVPQYRLQYLDDLAAEQYACEYIDEPNARASFVPVATLILAAAQIGLGRAAVEWTQEKRSTQAVTYTVFSQAKESPTTQIAIAEATSMIDCAELLAQRACADIDAAAMRGDRLSTFIRARIRMDTGQTAHLCQAAINRLMTANGAGAFALRNDLQRIWRDSEISLRHAQVEPEVAKINYGRALFGIDEFPCRFF